MDEAVSVQFVKYNGKVALIGLKVLFVNVLKFSVIRYRALWILAIELNELPCQNKVFQFTY